MQQHPRSSGSAGNLLRRSGAIEFRTLGEIALYRSEGDSPQSIVVQPMQVALLAYLSCARCCIGQPATRQCDTAGSFRYGFHRRDTLVGLLWPQRDEAHAQGALRQLLHRLRERVGVRILLTRGNAEVALNQDLFRCDVCAFEGALDRGEDEQAARIYNGVFLDGLHIKDAPEFDQWMGYQRDRLTRAHATISERLAMHASERGHFTAAVEWWSRLAVEDPYSSHIAIKLMEAFEAAGEPWKALRHAQHHAALIRRVFDADPSPELDTLADRLRRHAGK